MDGLAFSDSQNGSIEIVYELMHNTSGHSVSLRAKECIDNHFDSNGIRVRPMA